MFCPGNVGLCSVQLYMSHSAPTRSICILCTQTHTSISHICIYKQTVWSTEKFKGDPRLWDNLINMHCVHSHTHTHTLACVSVVAWMYSGGCAVVSLHFLAGVAWVARVFVCVCWARVRRLKRSGNQIHLEVSFSLPSPPPYFCRRLCFEHAAALSSKRNAFLCVRAYVCVC